MGPDHLKLYAALSKTDQFRKGKELVIARTGTSTSPVPMLEAYMAKGDIHPDVTKDKKVFRPTVRGHVDRLRKDGRLTYSRMRELKLDSQRWTLVFTAQEQEGQQQQ